MKRSIRMRSVKRRSSRAVRPWYVGPTELAIKGLIAFVFLAILYQFVPVVRNVVAGPSLDNLTERQERLSTQLESLNSELSDLGERLDALEAQIREFLSEVEGTAEDIRRWNSHMEPETAWTVAVEVMRLASRYDLSPDLIVALGGIESDWRLDARGRHGEFGPVQVLPATFVLMGGQDPADWQQSLEAGVRYLAWTLEASGGDLRLAVARYNAGINREARKALRLSGAYAQRVLGASVQFGGEV